MMIGSLVPEWYQPGYIGVAIVGNPRKTDLPTIGGVSQES